ncbi:MAG: succinyldiaminopimelate transaminase [Candidatus Obscuribacterales bacterium]|nr:succinyldiaminopimelate transaminase [Candidatus Obscuribacterales bacterium]
MNTRLELLQPYPFEKLADLLEDVEAPAHKNAISWSIGEPAHTPPQFVLQTLAKNLPDLGVYPLTRGIAELREAICVWLTKRFKLKSGQIDAETDILPVSGTREALFSIAQALIDKKKPLCVMPNPFYQIYEGAALLAGAQPVFYNLTSDTSFAPDFKSISKKTWESTSLIYVCSPSNPTGHCLSLACWQVLIELSQTHDFVIASDECYSELYRDEKNPPVGLLEAANSLGLDDFSNCLVFHSLSKRSNLPGLRSGFVAGDRKILSSYRLYRTYHGCTMSVPVQKASAAAWSDEKHVVENRSFYRRKFERVIEILEPILKLEHSPGGFYLWAPTPYNDQNFCRDLFEYENLLVLPGSYLSRVNENINPGANRVRMALVAPEEQCEEGALRLREFLESNREFLKSKKEN